MNQARWLALLRSALVLLAVWGCVAGPARAQTGAGIVNGGFEAGSAGQAPDGWLLPPICAEAGFRLEVSRRNPRSGAQCALLSREPERVRPGDTFGNAMQSVDAAPYRGKRVRFRAAVRMEVGAPGSQAQLWLRVDRPGQRIGFFDNMGDRPITAAASVAGGAWRTYEIVGDVEPDAERIVLGLLLIGGGRAFLDDAALEILPGQVKAAGPPRPLGERGRKNLVALTRLLGYIRHFHPSTEAAAADWDALAVEGMRAVEGAANAGDLARRLQALFVPVAPTVQIFPSSAPRPAPHPALSPPRGAGSLRVIAWRHTGFGTGDSSSVYRSERVRVAATPGDQRNRWVADLGGGVSCVVPLALYADARGTLPHPPKHRPAMGVREPLSAKDRATRLAAVALAWNVFQHFYPYFDVVGTDWPRALDEALRAAAIDPDETAFLATLRRLVARLHDGHGNVFHPRIPEPPYQPPIRLAWVEGRVAVEAVEPDVTGDLKPGDVVVALDGRPAAEALARTEALISGATVGWKRWRALGEGALLRGSHDSPITLTVRRPGDNGPTRTITLRRTLLRADPSAGLARPPQIDEVKPGIFYVDLDRISDQDFQSALPRLAKARGIVFDLRGYPRRVSPDLLGHLTDRPVTSARWNIPVVTRPDRRGMTFAFSNWTVAPRSPRLRAKIAFVTDGRAISYAETYLGIVEHYKLAEIVGEPTAGTNGNINFLTLPGGYRVIWTGMKVLKHDGSRHHGVGIRPTVPVSRTLGGLTAGRDELLERAVEAVRR